MEEEQKPRLLVKGGPNDDQTIVLKGPETTMGRQSGNDVVVPEAGVSRSHAQIVENNMAYYLRDLSSTNGTFLNSKKISDEDHELKDGDKIRLGASKVDLVFRLPAASTLQITLVEPLGEETGSQTLVGIPVGDSAAGAAATADPGARTEMPPAEADEGELYEGTVRLNVFQEGAVGMVVNFVQQLREKPEFRLLRMANNREGGVDVWLALRQPIPLRQMLTEVKGVSEVSRTGGRDLSPGSEDAPLTVVLKSADEGTASSSRCVSCKKPIDPAAKVCPSCGASQA